MSDFQKLGAGSSHVQPGWVGWILDFQNQLSGTANQNSDHVLAAVS